MWKVRRKTREFGKDGYSSSTFIGSHAMVMLSMVQISVLWLIMILPTHSGVLPEVECNHAR